MNEMTKLPRPYFGQPLVNATLEMARYARQVNATLEMARYARRLKERMRMLSADTFEEEQARMRQYGPTVLPLPMLMDIGPTPDDYLKVLQGKCSTPLGWLTHEELADVITSADTSKPAYGQGAWATAPSRVFSRLKPIAPLLADLRRELLSSVREWPRCRQHDVDCTVFYRRTQLTGDPLIYAAFACDKCLVTPPCPWNGKFHRDASTL